MRRRKARTLRLILMGLSLLVGALARLSMHADDLYFAAADNNLLNSESYHEEQDNLYEEALKLINAQIGDND